MSVKGRAKQEMTYWEQVATSRWGCYVSEVEQRAILRASRLAGSPTVALDLGCDGGRWSKLLADAQWQVVCSDIDPTTLDLCKRRIPAARCILVNPKDDRIPCDSESAGLLICIEVFPVVQSDWFPSEAYRVLKRRGLLVAVVHNLWSGRGLFCHLTARWRGNKDFYRLAYPPWRNRLAGVGFKMVFEEGYCWFPFRRDSDSSLVPLATRMERTLGLNRMVSLSPWIVLIAQKS